MVDASKGQNETKREKVFLMDTAGKIHNRLQTVTFEVADDTICLSVCSQFSTMKYGRFI